MDFSNYLKTALRDVLASVADPTKYEDILKCIEDIGRVVPFLVTLRIRGVRTDMEEAMLRNAADSLVAAAGDRARDILLDALQAKLRDAVHAALPAALDALVKALGRGR